jgi:hypothetical protein
MLEVLPFGLLHTWFHVSSAISVRASPFLNCWVCYDPVPPLLLPSACSGPASRVPPVILWPLCLQKVVSVGGPVLEQRLADVAAEAGPLPSLQGSLRAPQTPQDVRGSADSALSLAVGMGPAPPSQQGPTSGPPLFPWGHWTPLPPGTATPPETRERPPLGSTPAAPKPTVTIAEAVRPAGDDGAGAHWPFGSGSIVPERPMSVRVRRAPEVAAPSSGGPGPADGASWQEHAGAAVQPGPGGGSLARRSPPWRPQDSAVAVRFKEEKAPGGSDSLVREGAGQSGPGRGAAWAGSPLDLRDSQRNLLDSVASLGRGLGASQNPSMGQVSRAGERGTQEGRLRPPCAICSVIGILR